MSLDTYTKARKMLDYFDWPEGLLVPEVHTRARPGSYRLVKEYLYLPENKASLAILQAHYWKIIGERYDYRHRHFRRTERLNLYDKADECIADFHSLDLDTLLVNTGEWIMNREQENENG